MTVQNPHLLLAPQKTANRELNKLSNRPHSGYNDRSRQTQQQVQPARKTLPSTLISCKEQEHVWNGKKNHELKKVTHQYSIDHNKKRIRSIDKTLPWQTVLKFSDHFIKVKRVNKKKTRVDTLAIDRVTGAFDEQRVISNERAFKLFGKPGILKVSGSCNRIAVTPKF